jgi:GT2 family glycosyltransferase
MDRERDAMSNPVVLVLVATYRRPEELRRLGECLSSQTHPVAGVVVVDNAGDLATRMLVEAFPIPATYQAAAANRGCGAGLRRAEEHALENREATHWWILDDDAVPPPDALEKLLKAMEKSGAGMAVPLLTDERGRVWGFPEPVDPEQRRFFRRTDDFDESAKYFGSQPHPCLWTTGACQLVTVPAAVEAGLHRDDFWMLGEDLDFSMRVARVAGAVFIGDVRVPHLPPTASGTAAGRDYAKFCALLQNLTYLAFWNRGSGHLWRYLPGNFRRFFRTEGWSWGTLRDAGDCFVSGLSGLPAGRGSGERIRGRRGI